MSTPKGYSTGSKLDRLTSQFATVEPIKLEQYGLSVLAHTYMYVVGTDAVDSATTYVITAAAHAAQKGDVIHFTSGTFADREVRVDSVTVNTITLVETLASAPAAAVTFQILRHRSAIVDSSGSVIANVTLPAGSATEAKQDVGNASLASIDGKITAVNTGAVVVASSALPAGAATSAKQDTEIAALASLVTQTDGVEASLSSIDGKITAVDTGAVVVASSALPSGAATSAKQDTEIASLASIDGKITAVDTGAVVVSSSALPSGAATEATLLAASAKLPATLGQKAMAASLAVVLASDQPSIKDAGYASANAPVYNDYSSTAITSAAYVELVASTSSATQEIEIFDSSGLFLYLAIGAAASEVDQILIIPGGNGRVKLNIPAGTRVSAKAQSTTASVGALGINFYG